MSAQPTDDLFHEPPEDGVDDPDVIEADDLFVEEPDDGVDDPDEIVIEADEVEPDPTITAEVIDATDLDGRARWLPPGTGKAMLHKILRVLHPSTGWRLFKQIMRGIPRFFVWYRGWLRADDKAHLIEKGASPANKQTHHLWCLWRRKTSRLIAGLMAAMVLFGWWRFGLLETLAVYTALLCTMLAAMGRDAKKPVINATPRATRPVVTNELVRKVIASAVPGIKPDDWEDVRVLHPGVAWLDKNWWQVRVELPGTVEGDAVKKATKKLMSGFGVGSSQLYVEIDAENHGVVIITGTRTNPWRRPPVRTPLLEMDDFSIWDPIPVAADGRGRRIAVSLLFTGWLVGALPRMGKTNFARLLAAACALDPWCDLVVFDLKGASDWTMFEPVCRAFGKGHSEQSLQHLLKVLNAVQKEIDKRAERVSDLPVERWSTGQLTRDLALDAELDLQPLIVFIDEVQWAFGDAKYGKKIVAAVEGIVKTGAFVGVSIVLATQRPDGVSVPTKIRDVLGSRAAFYCTTYQMSTTILGTQAMSEGINAAALPRQKGVAIFYGADDMSSLIEASTVMTDLAEEQDVTKICQQGYRNMERIGRLPSQRKATLPHLVVVGRTLQEERGGYVPTAEFWSTVKDLPEFAEATEDELRATLSDLAKGGQVQRIKMNRRTTGDPDLPEGLHGRMAYKFLTDDDELAML